MFTIIIIGGVAVFVGFLINVFVYKRNPTKSLYGVSAPSIAPNETSGTDEILGKAGSHNGSESSENLPVGICVLAAALISIGSGVVLILLGQPKAATGVAPIAALVTYAILRRGFSLFPRI